MEQDLLNFRSQCAGGEELWYNQTIQYQSGMEACPAYVEARTALAEELAARTHLSRPAVSRHLRVLRAADAVAVYRAGTRTYYYPNAAASCWEELRALARREVLLCLASGAFLGLHFAAYFESLRYTSNSVSGNTI